MLNDKSNSHGQSWCGDNLGCGPGAVTIRGCGPACVQTMAASKRADGVPSALVARQSLNDEELVRNSPVFSRHEKH